MTTSRTRCHLRERKWRFSLSIPTPLPPRISLRLRCSSVLFAKTTETRQNQNTPRSRSHLQPLKRSSGSAVPCDLKSGLCSKPVGLRRFPNAPRPRPLRPRPPRAKRRPLSSPPRPPLYFVAQTQNSSHFDRCSSRLASSPTRRSIRSALAEREICSPTSRR